MTTFNSVDWEKRREIPFQLGDETVTKLDRARQGLAFIAQQWGWSGEYRRVGTTLHQKRNLMAASFGQDPYQRAENPQIADIFILFGQSGFANWVDYQGNNFEDQSENDFQFPGALALITPSGLPWRLSPYLVEGSYIYFEEIPLVEADFDPGIEYIDSLELWRAKVNGKGLVRISRFEGESETVEFQVLDWVPEELDRGTDAWLGTWGSKGTMETLERVCILAELHGVDNESSIRLRGRVVTYTIPEGFTFLDVYVDDELLGSRRFKGIENRTRGTLRASVSFEPGVRLTPAFQKVEIEVEENATNDVSRIDITNLLLENPQYTVQPSVKNAFKLPYLWYTPALQADVAVADGNRGTESSNLFLRLPYQYDREGSEWNRARAISALFSYYGKFDDSYWFKSASRNPVEFYDESYQNLLKRKFYQEDYLISLFREEDLPDDPEYTDVSLGTVGNEEPGWTEAKVSQYDPREKREYQGNFWAGTWYTRIGTDSLSGFLDKDIEEGKLIVLPYYIDEYPNTYLPRLREEWEERTNFMIPCYAFAAADLVAADEPVFDDYVVL